ncbi:PPC domain-containing protein [bacterium]|nr:PPC domain-containing protein [bacterium]
MKATATSQGGLWVAVLLAASLSGAWAQSSGPHIGYVYPAGSRQGTTCRVVVGGQLLAGADEAYVSGTGVRAAVLEYVRPLGNNELRDADWFLRELVRRRWSLATMRTAAQSDDPPELPDHPWLRDLDHKSRGELARLRQRLFDPRQQPNTQIADQVQLEISIAPDAPPGDRELRLATPRGLTNPMLFQVGTLPEVREEDAAEPIATTVELPAVLNGQIMPGEEDRFHVRLRQGRQTVIRVQARRLVPYLADAVPGWFQPVVALLDPQRRAVAYADDNGSDPDPVLMYKAPAEGVYALEVRDAIYRGRDDFVYRVAVGELPFVTRMFPLGAREGTAATVAVAGWNLPTARLSLDTAPGGGAVRQTRLPQARGLGNELPYAVDTLPETLEAEPNDSAAAPQLVSPPVVLNGRIGQPGDVDCFRFAGRAGEEVVAEVLARRLGSPVDSLLQLTGPDGALVVANDDTDDPAAGLVAHQADSVVRVKLPVDGDYVLALSDVQGQGGDECAYRLRLGPPRPDFVLRVTPAGLALGPGRSGTVTVQAIRRDGLAGDIDVVLKDAPAGFTARPVRIAGDKDTADMTVAAPRDVPRQAFVLQFEGSAQSGGTTLTRPAVPAEKMMQAFAYWHLVPQQEFLVAIPRPRPVPAIWRPLLPGVRWASAGPVRLPQGGTVQVQLQAPPVLGDARRTALSALRVELASHPRGLTVQGVRVTPSGLAITLQADAIIAHVGDAGNLILDVSTEVPGGGPADRAALAHERVSLGVLPPLPFEVVRP